MSRSPEQLGPWVRRFHPAPDSRTRLVCLPHAGGSATAYFPLSKALAPHVDVLAVQYPGRQERRHEAPIANLSVLADHVFAALRPLDDLPLALFGHSMGTLIAYEVALRFQDAGLPGPERLFASGRRAPSRHRPDDRIDAGSDEEIVAELLKLSGTPAAHLADPEVREMILPALRGDYRAVQSHRWDPARMLDLPVTVLTGDTDPRVSLDEAAAWEEHTTAATEVRVFPGGHFYLNDQNDRVAALVADRLARRDTATLHDARI
ncbi:alpha/beta fold hydrolase [Streptomyces sp. NPDC001941]|uniref:thioesterase II family protein n=1 Tax=Streptomyces sp. NPDC001941 TaxID=3154659 RepID=UPI00332F8130